MELIVRSKSLVSSGCIIQWGVPLFTAAVRLPISTAIMHLPISTAAMYLPIATATMYLTLGAQNYFCQFE